MSPGRIALHLVVLPLFMIIGCKKKQEATTAEEIRPVHVAPVIQTNVDFVIPAFGIIEPRTIVDITPQVTAIVKSITYKEGSLLKKGAVMYELDDRDIKENLVKAHAAAETSQAALRLADERLKRNERLAERKLISADALETLRNTVAESRESLSSAQAAVRQAELQLEYCTVRAPMTGLVGQSLVNPGALAVQGQTKLATIREADPIRVHFTIAGRDLPRVREAQGKKSAGLEVISGKGPNQRAYKGSVEFVESTIDATTGTISIVGILPNKELELWPGEFVSVNLKLGTATNALTVPQTAVEIGVAGPFVFVVDQGKSARVRPVALGQLTGNHVWVTEGLKENDLVVTEGQINLVDGTRVSIVEATTDQ